MVCIKNVLITLTLVMCTGCTSTLAIQYDELGRVNLLTGKGVQESSIEQDTVKVTMNNKTEPFRDLVNVQGLKND